MLVLDEARLRALRASARAETPAWKRVAALCDAQAERSIPSGYQGFDWADAVADLSLCWHATGEAKHARAAVRYARALLDDRFQVGDGKGGNDVVRHDSGYGIRTFGAYTALAYDWLRGAPGAGADLRRRSIERLDAWLSWYERSGYLADHPLANYFWGYLTALSLAGLAVGDDHPAGARWRESARRLLETKVVPTFRKHLRGGGWPEGWQYGEYVALEASLISEAHRTRLGVDLAKELGWFGDVVRHHVHALAPDRKSVHGGGTWGERPSRPSALAVLASTLVLDRLDPHRSAHARWLADHALPPLTREQAWVALLADRPDAPRRDPRAGEPASRSLEGTGLTFMRSDWSDSAVWITFQAGPRLTPDHQHKDQGHFELTRGKDWLLVDGGNSEGGATINHNSLLIDDGGRLITYSPNQGVWGTEVATTRYGDDGRAVVVTGEIADAWAPACVREGCSERAVNRATRTLVYVRPALLVVEDRVELADADTRATWAAHVTSAPSFADRRASAVTGDSRVDITVLSPDGAKLGAVREPNGGGDGPHRASSPWGAMWRVEVSSATGSERRRFLHWITTDAKAARAPDRPRRIAGSGLDGAIGDAPGGRVGIVFSETTDGGEIDLGTPPGIVVVAGLAPAARYAVTPSAAGGCRLRVARAADGRVATGGGFVRVALEGCRVQ
jgi:hypothetical protein